MSHYKYRKEEKNINEIRQQMHPVWRGIGLLIGLLIPVVGIASAIVFIDTALEKGWPIYWPLVGSVQAPLWMWQIKALAPLANKISHTPNILGYVVFSVIFILVFYTLLSILYAFLYRSLGVGRYTPIDVKQPKVKVKRYRR